MKTNYYFSKGLLTLLLLCCSFLLSNTSFGQSYRRGLIPVQEPAGGFAVDGDALANTCPDSGLPPNNVGDWFYNPGPAGSVFDADGMPLYPMGPGTMFIAYVDEFKSGDQTTFLETNKIPDNPNTYKIGPGNVPPKDDMQRVAALFTYGDPSLSGDPRFSFSSGADELWCLFAADRWKTNGESYIDFEFNQAKIELVGNMIVSSAPVLDSDDDPTGGRTPGDVLVTIYFERGGTQANLYIDKWEKAGPGSPYNWVRKDIDSDFPANSVFCTHNVGACPAPWDIYDQDENIYSVNQYAEGAICITKVMGAGICGNLSTVWARTKSSASTSAELKDIAGPPFQLEEELSGPVAACPTPVVIQPCASPTDIASQYTAWKGAFAPVPGEGVEPIEPSFSPALPDELPANARCTGWNITVTYTVTDFCGHTDQCQSSFQVLPDLLAPVLPELPEDGYLGCNTPPPPCPELSATDNCDGAVPVVCSAGAITGDCLKSQTFTFTATDACGLASSATVTYTWKVDTDPPESLQVMNDLVFECNDEIIIPAAVFIDDCDGPVTFECDVVGHPGEDFTTYDYPEGETTICFTAVDECLNSNVIEIKITVLPCKEEFCTYTQGFYGSQRGTACNLEEMLRGDIFTAGLLSQGDLIIGCVAMNNYILFESGDAALIKSMLPGGGSFGPVTGICDASTPCMNQYLSKGKLKDGLIAQTLVLGLNLRISEGLGDLPVEAGKWLTTQKKLYCAEGSGVVQMECLDDIIIVDPYWYYMLPENVLCYMEDNGYPMTIAGLYHLANMALGQNVTLPMMCETVEVTMQDIAKAVDMINNAFDECRVFLGYLDEPFGCPQQFKAIIGDLKAADLKVYPNPFNNRVTFEFVTDHDADARLEIFNMLGQKVSILLDRVVNQGELNRIEFKPADSGSEVFFYRFTLDKNIQNGKLIFNKQ
jgi:hypothetical protein